ncbi:MAG TPA: septal ring lytic transglycosylase RlpA family protein [Thermoanaerobaculia bacterium]|nr:septal ring lytic transglycosylase RlpA family protein [Thermoanaerobaculia bacterium]
MKRRIVALAAVVVLTYGCATTAPAPATTPETMHGVASWYGEEFAGRTTANGEIFDPRLLTAAHRTLPFGTVLDITNPKTTQTVRVRVNDRGPYVGNRVIDLSYAAAQQIGLIEPGIGEVDIRIVKVGSGEREPPAPFDVRIADAPNTARTPADPPPVAFPIPGQTQPAAAVPAEPAVVDNVEVQVQRGETLTRRQVSPDGKTFEDVPLAEGEAPTASGLDEQRRAASRPATAQQSRPASRVRQFVVQVGAFAVEENAKALQERLGAIGHRAFIDRDDLYRVRIGPFATREQAVQARAALEANGMSAMIVSE